MSTPPLNLHELGDFDTPEVVRPALRRFRRGLLAVVAIVAVLSLTAGYLAGRPRIDTPRELLQAADARHLVGQRVSDGAVSVLVLDVGRVADNTYAMHFVAFAEGLSRQQALSARVQPEVFLPPPGQDDDLGGLRLQTGGDLVDSGYGAGEHVVEAWVLLPAGTERVPIAFHAGVPAAPGGPDGVGGRPAPPGGLDRLPGDIDGSAAGAPPTAPGTLEDLGVITLELPQLGVPDNIWRR